MRTLVDSLKRLYLSNKITEIQIEERYKAGIINLDEYKYIKGV